MSLALSVLCIIYFAYSVIEWSTLFKYYCFIVLFALASATAVLLTAIFSLTRIYASL